MGHRRLSKSIYFQEICSKLPMWIQHSEQAEEKRNPLSHITDVTGLCCKIMRHWGWLDEIATSLTQRFLYFKIVNVFKICVPIFQSEYYIASKQSEKEIQSAIKTDVTGQCRKIMWYWGWLDQITTWHLYDSYWWHKNRSSKQNHWIMTEFVLGQRY